VSIFHRERSRLARQFFSPSDFGIAAVFTPASGTAVAVTCVIAEQATTDQAGDVGVERRRRAQIVLRTSQVAAPERGDAVVVDASASPRWAGTWTILGTAQADDISVTCDAEQSDVDNTAGQARKAVET